MKMKSTLIGLCAVLAVGAVQAQGVTGMKPGLWEARTLRLEKDGKDMLPQMKAAQEQMRQSLASMPAEQRKQMEAMMGAQGGDPTVQRLCISPEMAKSDQAFKPRLPPGCPPPKVNRSGDHATVEGTCKLGGDTLAIKGQSTITGDQITSKSEVVTTESGGARHTMVSESRMKFIGSDCGDVKPLDQMLKAMQAGAASK